MSTQDENPMLVNFLQQTGWDAMWIARGRAIESYAILESSLCRLFALLSGTELDIAGFIFFKISAYRTRLDVMEKILRKKHQLTYSIFWNSFYKGIEDVSDKRNHLAHDHTILDTSGSFPEVRLVPGNIWAADSNTPYLTVASILDFIDKSTFFTELCTAFWCYLQDPPAIADNLTQTWQGIFQQPVEYPPPKGHPLYESFQKLRSLPPTSQE